MEQFVTGLGFTTLEGAVAVLSGIVVFVIVSLITGGMVPRKVHNDRIADRDVIIKFLTKQVEDQTIAIRNFATSGETSDRLHTALTQEVNNGAPSGTPSG